MSEDTQRDTGDAPPEAPKAEGSGRGLGHVLTLGVIVVVCLGVVCAAAYYQSEITGMVRTRPWDKSAPRQAVQRFLAAVQAGDVDAAQEAAPGLTMEVDEDGVVSIRPPGAPPQMPLAPVERFLPIQDLDQAPVTYVYRMGLAKVTYRTADGQSVVVGLKNDGGMRVVSIVLE